MSDNSIKQKDGINEGTKIKASLQLRAIEFLKSYSCSKTLDSYARLLCWDIHTTYRTALDSYIMPMYEHGFFIYEGNDKFSFCNGKANKQLKKGKTEKEESPTEYMIRKEKEKLNEPTESDIRGK
jgi:hypothetical protein